MARLKYSCLDLILTVLGLGFLLLDIVLDIWAVVNFYQDKAYVSLVILVLLLVGSSVLAQAFSWLWYDVKEFEEFQTEPVVRSLSLSPGKVKLLHVLQCGIYFRLCKLWSPLCRLCSVLQHASGTSCFVRFFVYYTCIIKAESSIYLETERYIFFEKRFFQE